MSRSSYIEAVECLQVLKVLAAFDPHVAGTPPLGIALLTSDIDILCHAPDDHLFAQTVWDAFAHHPAFALRQWTGTGGPVIATFVAHGWTFEIFGQDCPVPQQQGWRHFLVEQRLLALGGPAFRAAILAAREAGLKTEPAFAALLGLEGDPYRALLQAEAEPDSALAALLARAGFG